MVQKNPDKSLHVAVVTSHYDDSSEESLIARRIAGAVACGSDVDILVAQGPETSTDVKGAFRVHRFSALGVTRRRKEALWEAILGESASIDLACDCNKQFISELNNLPAFLKGELVRSEGGHSNQLYEYLSSSSYDAVVFVGYKPASTCFGIQHLPRRTRVIVAAMASDDPLLDLDIYDAVFHEAECFLVMSETERDLLYRRLSDTSTSIRNIAFALRVNKLAADTVPVGFDNDLFLLISQDWEVSEATTSLMHLGALVSTDFSRKVKLMVVGRGWSNPQSAPWMKFHEPLSRSDLWRWMSRALAVIDPQPRRILGREVLEAMMYGIPVLVREDGGATREHAEVGNGGLWYKNYSQLRLAIDALITESTRSTLGAQGKKYAQRLYGDPGRFIEQIAEVVLG